ncbi:hypothetical protein M446_7007 (plasmid) [Methylobacterium sp. 4-46]|nr:hypothetical protein M446_7007 [Methylobacterium sp. 4-46]
MEFADFNSSREHCPITDDRVALIDALQKADDGSLLHHPAEIVIGPPHWGIPIRDARVRHSWRLIWIDIAFMRRYNLRV